ncbi:unnamed protein product [Prorocentrum cordatum]|uniref:Uncharacterized protein n=1 Tax=Prorocentrum cordatum TaxID=2364126 RepID=A0ABN9SJN7_9DINO|nr:unnamed protein product [Polarella glacialis]
MQTLPTTPLGASSSTSCSSCSSSFSSSSPSPPVRLRECRRQRELRRLRELHAILESCAVSESYAVITSFSVVDTDRLSLRYYPVLVFPDLAVFDGCRPFVCALSVADGGTLLFDFASDENFVVMVMQCYSIFFYWYESWYRSWGHPQIALCV